MNDEVSVAELLEREGWGEPPSKPNGRVRVVAVMLAVVLGCGLAALLVHFGSQNSSQADGTLFQLPHGPTGGLAGGGVPAEPPSGTEVTDGNTTVVVTNVSQVEGTGADGIPWHHWLPISDEAGVTLTEQPGRPQQQDPGTPSLTTTPTTPSPGGGLSSSAPQTSTTTTPPKTSRSCILVICW